MKKRYFVLTELLAVISVNAILAALIVPQLMTQKQKAQQIACLENLKQIVQASDMFTQENQDYYPTYVKFNNINHTILAWDDQISPYLGITLEPSDKQGQGVTQYYPKNYQGYKTMLCPSDTIAPYTPNAQRRSYTLNAIIRNGREIGIMSGWYSRTTSLITTPSETILAHEYYKDTNLFGVAMSGLCRYQTDLNNTTPHATKTNFAMADGHTQTMENSETFNNDMYLWKATKTQP